MSIPSLQLLNIESQISNFLGALDGENSTQVKLARANMQKVEKYTELEQDFMAAFSAGRITQAIGFFLQLLQIFGGDGTSGQSVDPTLKQFWSWVESNQENGKRTQSEALQSLSSENKSKQPSISG
jgi:hypothetical protein